MNEFNELIDILRKVTRTKLNIPKSFLTGEEFEDFAREVLFPKEVYDLLHKTHNYKQNSQDFVEDSLLPDFKFRNRDLNIEFYIECKYRDITKIQNNIDELTKIHESKKRTHEEEILLEKNINKIGTVEILPQSQYNRLLELNIKQRVLICIGLYYEKTKNIYPYVIPIEHLTTNSIHIYDLENYIVPNNYTVIPDRIAEFYLDKSSNCISCKKTIENRLQQPLCRECHFNWQRNRVFKSEMNYCHSCGKKHKSSVARPNCIECYKKNINVVFDI
ncbi:cytochrome c3 family protein [Leptospira terpstrae]|uniref:Uncharacterized protein n=1 Tax=Leptospira terpstrae serovar Hualin str. LT 11-33 = ATCC 700639 TaxID=1257025 RepID=N1W1M6_9LEPT|nr:cytochrome c3 family protein [Leptospira terpstrae]EMY61591.1 hypothetical protein LEP1GSC203_1094 [Leptospira terpstrae serovar Hualin str. LT 11-33 = ATCC 700639]